MRDTNRNGIVCSVFSVLVFLCIGSRVVFMGMNQYTTYGFKSIQMSVIVCAAIILAVLVFGFVIQKSASFTEKKRRIGFTYLLEGVFLIVLASVGLSRWGSMISGLAKLTEVGAQTYAPLDYVYRSVCEAFFWFLGKKTSVYAVIGIVFGFLNCSFAFFIARKLKGRIAGIVTFAAMLFFSVYSAGVTLLRQEILSVCAVLLSVSLFLLCISFEEKEVHFGYCMILYFLLAVSSGVSVFVHPFSAVMFIGYGLYLTFFLKRGEKNPCIRGFLKSLGILAVSGGVFFLLVFAKSVDLKLSIQKILLEYFSFGIPDFRVVEQNFYRIWIPIDYSRLMQSAYLILAVFGCIALLWLAFKKNTNCFPVTFFVFAGFCLFIFQGGTDRLEYLTAGLAILTGICLEEILQLFRQPKVAEETVTVIEEICEPKDETEELEPERKVKFLENPLPEPKRHVPKELDYDISISEDDDFDI